MDEARVNFRLGDLPFEKDAQPLGLLHVEGELCLVLLNLGELEGLFQIGKFLLFLHANFVNLLDLELQSGDLAIFGGQRALLRNFCGSYCLELHACSLSQEHRSFLAHVVANFSLLELLKELVI